MRHEQNRDFAPQRGADFLLHFRRMAMIPDFVRAEIFVDFGEKLLDRSLTPSPRRARLGVDYDGRRIDQIAPNKRQQAEQ